MFQKLLARSSDKDDEDAWALTWMEYMMILKQRTAKDLPSQREWLSKCLVGAGRHGEGQEKKKTLFVLYGDGVGCTLQHQEK